MNSLEKLLELYPDKPWDWVALSKNPNISWEFINSTYSSLLHDEIAEYKDSALFRFLDYQCKDEYKIFREKIHFKYSRYFPWNWDHVAANPNITWEIVVNNILKEKKKYLDVDIFFSNLSHNQNITWDIVLKNNHRYRPWSWVSLSCNPNITWDIVQNNPHPCQMAGSKKHLCDIYCGHWDYWNLTTNPNITPDIIFANPDINWNRDCIDHNPTITWDFIFNDFTESGISFDDMSSKPCVTWNIVLAYPELDWCWVGLSKNPNITWNIVQTNPLCDWNWTALSSNPNITWEIVQANPHCGWNWSNLSANSNITPEIIHANHNKPWDWMGLSVNPSITPEFVHANHDKPWNWKALSGNKFQKDYNLMKKMKLKLISTDSKMIKADWIRLSTDKYSYLEELRALAHAMNLNVYHRDRLIELIAVKIWLFERYGLPYSC